MSHSRLKYTVVLVALVGSVSSVEIKNDTLTGIFVRKKKKKNEITSYLSS